MMNKQKLFSSCVKAFDRWLCLPKWTAFDKVLERAASYSDDFFFIQVGANDGVVHDPLYRHVVENNWSGILVEPVRHYFDRLMNNYRSNKNLIFANVAISDKEEVREFYRIKEGQDHLPAWSKGLGSFYLDVLLKHKWAIPDIEQHIVNEKVQCCSFASLLKAHHVEKVDLLLVDTEGYDFEILKQIDFNQLKPTTIVYEHKHLSKENRKNCEALLKDQGYCLTRRFSNTMACL